MQAAEPAKVWAHSPARRLLLLLACVGVGTVAGLVGSSLTDSDLWYLAIPLCVALGWLLVADPTACERRGL